ncbi:hypothetical protein V8C42DRAFT_349752 [Trichoderma barbatum]
MSVQKRYALSARFLYDQNSFHRAQYVESWNTLDRELKHALKHASKKCVSTGVMRTQQWSKRGGYRDFTDKLEVIDRRTKYYKRLHIMNAPSVVVAIAIEKLRHVDTNGKDNVTGQLIKIIRTNHVYEETDLADDTIILIEDATDLPVNEDAAIFDFISMDEVTQTRNQAQFMLEVQQFDNPFASPRTPTPPPPIMRTTKLSITREEALMKVEELILMVTSKK